MDMTKTLIAFKQERKALKKKPVNMTLVKARLENIEKAISEKSQYIGLVSESEKIDFFLFMLESFMVNSGKYDISMTQAVNSEQFK